MEGLNLTKENNLEKKDSPEEKYKKEILPLINALCPDEEPFEEFEERVMIDLEESLKKIQIAQGRAVELNEDKNLKEIKELLISRIKAVLKDGREHDYEGDKERLDADLVLRSKIALLLSGDHSDLESYFTEWKDDKKIPKPIEKLSFDNLDFYLRTRYNNKERKLSEKEFDELVKAGFGKQLATIQEYYFKDKFENIPESFLLELIESKNDTWLNDILKNYPSQKKYSHKVSDKLILKGYTYVVLQNLEKFDDINLDYLKSLIMTYSPEYPWHINDILNSLGVSNNLKLKEDEKSEIIDFVFKHNYTQENDLLTISDIKIKEKYQNFYESFKKNFLGDNKYKILQPNELSKEEMDNIKKYIEGGYFTFIHNIGIIDYRKYFFENDYEWLRDQVVKNDQENLLLVFHELKTEDQEKYANKLIDKGQINILKTLIKKGCFSENSLSGEIYEKLLEFNFDAPIVLFRNINEKRFLYLLKNKYKNWNDIETDISHFSFSENSLSKEVIGEITNRTDNFELRFYYINNFLYSNKEKRGRVLKLIDEIIPFYSAFNLVTLYIEKFYDIDNKEEKEAFLKRYGESIDKVSKNKSIECNDSSEYKIICEAVYPKRNYDTYIYIDGYKDRSEDLNSYTFNKEGYKLRLSGVVGYKIKDGYEKNPKVLSEYQVRIKDIEKLAKNEENLFNFINTKLEETESKTLEGKIIEYIRKNRNDSTSIDLLLAYQLHGNYDQFVRDSTDHVDMYEKMEGKEYVMLSELSERYGDLMKETLKEINKKVSESEDAKLFVKDNKEEIKKGEKLSLKIYEEFSKIPEDRLTTVAIQKKIAKSIRNTFQQIPSIDAISESFSAFFTKENFSSFLDIFREKIGEIFQEVNKDVLVDVGQLETLRQKTYEEIKNELDKYEEIKEIDETKNREVKMSKERSIKGYFSKNRENAHARMIGDICIAANPKMLENKNYFEFVLFDESRKKCVGTVMLLNMEEPDGKKYLLYCPNPSVDLVSQVSAEKLYKLITSEIISFAKQNNYDGILVDKRHGHSTNRSGIFQTTLEKSILLKKDGGENIFNLKNKHILSNIYEYQKNLNTVWLKDNL